MFKAICFVVCVFLILETNGFVRRDVQSTKQSDLFASVQNNMDQFKQCIDQTLGKATADGQNQLKPVFNVIGDTILRFSKAFEDLAGSSTSSPDPDLNF